MPISGPGIRPLTGPGNGPSVIVMQATQDDIDVRQLRVRRARLGLTQEQLAEATGLTRSTIQNLENGRSPGTVSTWRLIDQALREASH